MADADPRRLIPPGGAAWTALLKYSADDYAADWLRFTGMAEPQIRELLAGQAGSRLAALTAAAAELLLDVSATPAADVAFSAADAERWVAREAEGVDPWLAGGWTLASIDGCDPAPVSGSAVLGLRAETAGNPLEPSQSVGIRLLRGGADTGRSARFGRAADGGTLVAVDRAGTASVAVRAAAIRRPPPSGDEGDVSAGDVARIVDHGIKDFARAGGRQIALGDLLQTDADRIESAVSTDSTGYDEAAGELNLVSNEPDTLTLPIGRAYSAAEKAKLAAVEAGATADQTPEEIVAGLSGLSGAARLPASAVRDLPAGGGGLSESQVDARVAAAANAATDSSRGNVELATDAEAVAGTDAVRAVTPSGLQAAIGDAIPAYGQGDAGQALRVDAAGDDLGFVPDPPALTIASRGSLPSAAGYSAGQKVDVGGEWYTLVSHARESNVISGSAAALSGGYYGTARIEWLPTDPYNIRLYLDRTALGSSPPASLWLRFRAGNGFSETDIMMSRAPADITHPADYAYHKRVGDPGIPITSGAFRVEIFADAALSTPLALHSAPRWELDARSGLLPPLATESEMEAGTEAGVRSMSPAGVRDAIEALAPGGVEDDSVTPAKIAAAAGSKVAGRVLSYDAGLARFASVELHGRRELISGPLARGAAVTDIGADSGIAVNNLDEPLNVRTDAHGILGGDVEFRVSGRSSDTQGFAPESGSDNGATSAAAGFLTSPEAIARTAAYNGSTQLGAVLAHAELYQGTALIGAAVLRMHRDGTGATALSLQYLHHAGHGLAGSLSLSASVDMAYIDSGVPRATSPGGSIFQFRSALAPAGDTYADGDLGLVWSGAAKGLYRMRAATVHAAADTGLGGRELHVPRFIDKDDTGWRYAYFARTAYASDRETGVQVPASAANAATLVTPGGVPAAVDRIELSYRRNPIRDGRIRIVYSTARTYAGDIALAAGGSAYLLRRRSSTVWELAEMDNAAILAAINAGTWALSEPGQAGTTTTWHWDPVILAGASPGPAIRAEMPSAAVTITTPAGSAAGAWSGWTRIAELTVSAAEAGQIQILAELRGETGAQGVGGGDRLIVERRITRTRGAASSTLASAVDYAPRNIAPASASTAEAFAAASRIAADQLTALADAEAGDALALEARIVQQAVSGTRSMTFRMQDNSLAVAPVGARGPKGDPGTVDGLLCGRVTRDSSGQPSVASGAGFSVARRNSNTDRITFEAPRSSADYCAVVSAVSATVSHRASLAAVAATHIDVAVSASASIGYSFIALDS